MLTIKTKNTSEFKNKTHLACELFVFSALYLIVSTDKRSSNIT